MDLKIRNENTWFFANASNFVPWRGPGSITLYNLHTFEDIQDFNHFFERPYLTLMYLILLQYIRPLAAIEHYLEAHNAFLETQVRAGRFILTGRRKPKTGSIIVCRASSRREVEAILAEDPMDKFQLAVYDIIEFEPNTFELAGISS